MKIHICGHSHSFYAAFQTSVYDHQNLSCEFLHAENASCNHHTESCCTEESECDDCTDLVKKVETDIDYVFTHHHLVVDISEHEIFSTDKIINSEDAKNNFRVIKPEHCSPPNSKITSVWLC